MMHLVVHLVEEFELCGLVHTQWMYSKERYMKALKGYVKNMCNYKVAWLLVILLKKL